MNILDRLRLKPKAAIDSALGGVLFIDEAYSLGCNDGRRKSDSFSKECIDTINQNLSEKKGQFICIIAGYPEELERHFFSVNPGLKRRFSFHYQIEGYDWKELAEILCRKISSIGWKLDSEARKWLFQDKGFMEDHIKDFPNFGGDIETLLLNIKIVHGRRVFGMIHESINLSGKLISRMVITDINHLIVDGRSQIQHQPLCICNCM